VAREEPALHLIPDITLTGETKIIVRHKELKTSLLIFFNAHTCSWEVNCDKDGTYQRMRFASEQEIAPCPE
jgi:hypothetical protein